VVYGSSLSWASDNAMKISYRVTSCGVLASSALAIAVPALFPASREPIAPATVPGAVTFDVCLMWRQIPVTERLSILAWFGSFVSVVVYMPCVTARDIVLFIIWAPSVAFMNVRHLLR